MSSTPDPFAELSVHPTTDDPQVRSDWTTVDDRRIAGVEVREIRSVVTDDGRLTEMWRADWRLDDHGVDQVFVRTLAAGSVSAWHVHLRTSDRLFCAAGDALLVLYDARTSSPTHGMLSEHRFGEHRPMTISVPPGVVHGVRAIGGPALLVNAVDHAYRYDGPDHHRLAPDSPEIPYRF